MERMKAWRFFFDGNCASCEGVKYDAGNIVMGHQTQQTVERSIDSKLDEIGDRIKFSIEATGKDLQINLTRNKMFEQPTLNKWGIFYQTKDHMQARTLVTMMEKTLIQFDYQAKPMAMFPIQGSNLEIWKQEIASKLKPDVQVVILLLPGGKNGSDLYHDLKRMLLQDLPVISQVVLTGTVNYGKNLKSIVAKLIA